MFWTLSNKCVHLEKSLSLCSILEISVAFLLWCLSLHPQGSIITSITKQNYRAVTSKSKTWNDSLRRWEHSSTKTALHKKHLRIHGNDLSVRTSGKIHSSPADISAAKELSCICKNDEFWPWFLLAHIIRFSVHRAALKPRRNLKKE